MQLMNAGPGGAQGVCCRPSRQPETRHSSTGDGEPRHDSISGSSYTSTSFPDITPFLRETITQTSAAASSSSWTYSHASTSILHLSLQTGVSSSDPTGVLRQLPQRGSNTSLLRAHRFMLTRRPEHTSDFALLMV